MSVSCFQQMRHIDVHQNCHVELFSGKIKTLIYLSKQILVSLKKKKKRRYHPIILTVEGGKIKHWVFAARTL